jgi:hypothetical protein
MQRLCGTATPARCRLARLRVRAAMSGPMKLVRVVVVLAVCLLIPACIKNKVTKANFDKINVGMSLDEVEKILGKGSKDEGDGSGVAAQFGVALPPAGTTGGGETWKWERGGNSITVHIRDGKVVNKSSSGL